MTYGFRKDHCNSGYSYAQHLLLDELSPIGNNYRKIQAQYKRLQDNGNTDALRDDVSDVLEAVGSICDGCSREARLLQMELECMHEIGNIAFGNVSLSLKNLANPASVLENSFSSREALLEDTYGGKQKPFIGNGTQEKIRP